MKHWPLLVALAAAACLPVRAADAAIGSEALARLESIHAFCTRLHPQGSERFARQLKLLVGDATPEALDTLRRSDDYRRVYDETAEELAKVPKGEAQTTCAQAAQAVE